MEKAIKRYKEMYLACVLLGIKELDAKQQESEEYKLLAAKLFGAREILVALGVDTWNIEQSVKV